MSWLRKLFGGGGAKDTALGPIQIELPPRAESIEVYGDQPLRKQWAEDILRGEGMPVNPHLPMVESEAEVRLRSPRAVADRLLALVIVAFKGSEAPEQSLVEAIVAERGLRPLFTPDELAFIDDHNPDHNMRVQFSWRCEAAWALLWALQHVEGALGLPRRTCDVPFLSETVYRETDLAARGLRPASDILNEADLIYRCHWAVRDAALAGAPPPAGLHPGVTIERHHALNWLIGYGDLEWDDVSTDT